MWISLVLTSKLLNCGYEDWIKLPRCFHHAAKELSMRRGTQGEEQRRVGVPYGPMVRVRMCAWTCVVSSLAPDRHVAEMKE